MNEGLESTVRIWHRVCFPGHYARKWKGVNGVGCFKVLGCQLGSLMSFFYLVVCSSAVVSHSKPFLGRAGHKSPS